MDEATVCEPSASSRNPMPSPRKTRSPDVDQTSLSGQPRHTAKRRRESDEGDGPARTRRKTACEPCRVRKMKCDGGRPTCSLCSVSARRCEYTDPLPQKLTLESATQLLTSKLHELQSDIRKLATPAVAWTEDDQTWTRGAGMATTESPTSDPDRPSRARRHVVESSKDFLQIPAHRTTADSVLTWPVFEGRFPSMSLVGFFFVSHDSPVHGSRQGAEYFTTEGGLEPVSEEQLPSLVDGFLQNVHTKNPILDVEGIVVQARKVASEGLRWDPWSCLVLVAAALGAIAKPFHAGVIGSPESLAPIRTASEEDLRRGESCFVLACRRLGSLKPSLLGSQCYFFAGVYLMYTLRPIESWQYFSQSSTMLQLYVKTHHGLIAGTAGRDGLSEGQTFAMPYAQVKQRRMEDSLYWSCFKSECEFRVELPLPQSEIATYCHARMFPSPPSPAMEENQASQPSVDPLSPLATTITLSAASEASVTASAIDEQSYVRKHAKRLCNEEESWYYYLTEIALRRIGNRIINTFFGREPAAWTDVRPLLHIALEFETQVSAWSANLPAAMQHWETTYTIKAPPLNHISGGIGAHVSRELSWAIENRLLEMRSWLYQPFLYYLVHGGCSNVDLQPPAVDVTGVSRESVTPARVPFRSEDTATLAQFIRTGIECNLKILEERSLRHRHHGLWFDMRSITCASLILLAVAKSGYAHLIPGGIESLCGADEQRCRTVGGRIGHVLDELDFWSVESPDLKHHRVVLEDVTKMVLETSLPPEGL